MVNTWTLTFIKPEFVPRREHRCRYKDQHGGAFRELIDVCCDGRIERMNSVWREWSPLLRQAVTKEQPHRVMECLNMSGCDVTAVVTVIILKCFTRHAVLSRRWVLNAVKAMGVLQTTDVVDRLSDC